MSGTSVNFKEIAPQSHQNINTPFLSRTHCQIFSRLEGRCSFAKMSFQDSTSLKPNTIYQFIMGKDKEPIEMDSESKNKNLQDAFPILLDKIFPLTLIDLISQARKVFSQALSEEVERSRVKEGKPTNIQVFRVAEGGMVPSSVTPQPERTYRLTIALFALGMHDPDIFVSTGSEIDDPKLFLQVMSWDKVNSVFNFYARLMGTWVWAGNSQHALEPQTRGQSPFCGHVNGATIMKELKIPWSNWNSSMSSFDDKILPEDSPLIKKYPFLADRSEEMMADNLEILIRAGISRWNNARISKSIDGVSLLHVPYFMRQLLSTTTVNLVSSIQVSNSNANDGELDFPNTLFLNADAFPILGLKGPFNSISISRNLYTNMLKKYEHALDDKKGFKQLGDTYFAFLIPEPAAEDSNLLRLLIKNKILTPRFAASLLMIDFCNPVYSARREVFLKYIPESIKLIEEKTFDGVLEKSIVESISKSAEAKIPETPEYEFLQNWQIAQTNAWTTTFNKRLVNYLELVEKNATEKFESYFQLAESRRHTFKQTPLFEFPLIFASSNMSNSMFPLVMQPDGTVISYSISAPNAILM